MHNNILIKYSIPLRESTIFTKTMRIDYSEQSQRPGR